MAHGANGADPSSARPVILKQPVDAPHGFNDLSRQQSFGLAQIPLMQLRQTRLRRTQEMRAFLHVVFRLVEIEQPGCWHLHVGLVWILNFECSENYPGAGETFRDVAHTRQVARQVTRQVTLQVTRHLSRVTWVWAEARFASTAICGAAKKAAWT
jgi:hypothetical protein